MSTDFIPFELNLSVEDARPASARVPEGKYLLECQGCEHPVKNPTTSVVSVVFVYRIMQGPDAYPNAGLGGRLIDFVTLYTPNKPGFKPFPLSQTLVALGRTDIVEAFSKMQSAQRTPQTQAQADAIFDRISQAVKGRKAVGHIADQPGVNPPRSRIDGLSPESEWDVLRKSSEYNPNVGPGFAAAAPRANGPAPAAASDLFSDLDRTI
jgi:hypothetical protein